MVSNVYSWAVAIFWDHRGGGNVEHLAEHGVTPDEAERVIEKYFDDREPSHSTPEYWVLRGFTAGGRFLLVVFEYLAGEETAIPATAFEPEVI